MSAAPRPSQAGPRGLKFPSASLPLKPTQAKNPPSKMKMNSVIIRNKLAGLSMLAFGDSGPFDPNGFQFNGLLGFVVRAARQFGNFCGDVHAFDHFAEDGVFAIEPGRRRHGNEKLASVRAGSGIGHGEFSRFVVLQGFVKLVAEAIARVAGPRSERASSLNHELRN